jgi:DNA polymerase I
MRELICLSRLMDNHTATPLAADTCLLIVDGHAYAYRAFHAIAQLNAPDGSPTNAIFGFIKALGRLTDTLHPSHLAVAWDGGLAEERLAALPQYKAQRPPMPEALRVQFDGMNEWLAASGLACLLQDGVEADDWIASLSRMAVEQGTRVVIASSDKDFMQLVSPLVRLINPADKSQTLWADEQVREKTGVSPAQVVDWLSLVGDSVDNIPGVPGVGPKTAADLLRQFGSVEALYGRLGEVKSERVRAALAGAESEVRRNLKLIRLRDDLPLLPTLDEFKPKPARTGDQRRLAQRWGFKSLLPREAAPEPQQELLL